MDSGNAAPLVVAISASGECTVSAEAISSRFGWSARIFQSMMRRGLISAIVERGQGVDAGTWRVSVRSGNRRWIAVIASDGTLVTEKMRVVRAKSLGTAVPHR